MRTNAASPARIAVIAFSTLTHDARVSRTISALLEAGYDVAAAGFGSPPAGVSRFVALPVPMRGLATRIRMVLTQAPATVTPALAPVLHQLSDLHRAARVALAELRPDVIHANDWPTLPAAVAVKAARGARIVYDSHEFATEEHAHLRRWRLLLRAHVGAIESRGVAASDRVITVSDGVAREMAALYNMKTAPAVVRNVPHWVEQPFRAAASPRRLLFHGILKDWRGIETILAAMPRLPNHVLTLRGDAAPAYAGRLAALIDAAGIADRVSLEPPVHPDAVVPRANAADLGVFLGPLDTRQNRYALPNKLFEYMMAGLGVLVSPGDDMVRLVERHGFGRAVEPDADALVAALTRLSDPDVNQMKRSALMAARVLNWEHERERLLALYRDLLSPGIAEVRAPGRGLAGHSPVECNHHAEEAGFRK